ncbi:hypothetical protein GGR57DRAFT_496672 [Xylariaceae sp. FL1272]|nr:hypothetical protein GGR57DRAFT_496672 [Xylariaceae sp. FL1272]
MAEIVGLATGLIGACDVIVKASKGLAAFTSDVKNAPKEWTAVKIELENIEAIISAIRGYLTSSKASPKMSWYGLMELARYSNIFNLALSLDGWELFLRSSTETTEALKEVRDDLQRVVDILRPMEGMRKDLEGWEEHLRVIRDAVAFSSLTSSDLDKDDDVVRREELLSFITDVKLESRHRDVAKIRHGNTGTWTIDCERFQDCLAEHAIVDYFKGTQNESNPVVIAAYLTYQDQSLHSTEAILQAVLRSVGEAAYARIGAKEKLLKLQRECQRSQNRRPTTQECVQVPRQFAADGMPLVLCFDGIDGLPDECQQQLLKVVSILARVPRIKTLIMSRSSIYLGNMAHSTMIVSASEADLELYFSDETEQILGDIVVERSRLSLRELGELITSTVVRNSKGMFLLASLQIQHLRSAASIRDVLGLLEELPEGVDEQYSLYFSRLRSQRWSKLGLTAIKWVSSAARPLQAPEVLEALAVRDSGQDIDPTGMSPAERVVQAAGGLLVLDVDSNVIRLVHESLKD